MEIKIDEEGKIYKDGKEIEKAKINAEFLEEIVNSGISKDLTWDIKEGTTQWHEFIKKMKDNLTEESQFLKEISTVEEKIAKQKEELSTVEEKLNSISEE